MAVKWEKESTRPGWGWALGIGVPMLALASAAEDSGSGGASTVLTFLAFGVTWVCVGKGKLAENLRSAFSARTNPASSARREPPGNLSGARRLAAKLTAGEVIEAIPASFRLRDGEEQHARFDGVTLYEWFGVDVEYKTIHNQAFHPVGWLIDATVHKKINERNRARAAEKAAPTWREVTGGALHLTSHRVVLDDGVQLRSWWFPSIVGTESDRDGVVLRLEDEPAVLLRLPEAYVLLVALHHLAWNEVVELPSIHA